MENTERENENGTEGQRPMKKERTLVYETLFGAIKVEVHRFHSLTGAPSFLKAKIARIFTNQEGQWRSTNYYGSRDLENLAKATAAANNYIVSNTPATDPS